MKRKGIKISAYIAGSLIVLLGAFHLWFVNHAEDLLEELVKSKSNGKLKLQVKHFRFNWFSNHMQLRKAVFYSTDTATAPAAYRFSVERINLSVKDILPLIFEKKIVIDSLSLLSPDIVVTRLRPSGNTDSASDKNVTLPEEMGRVYKSIQDALVVLRVSQFHIDNGRFTLVNKIGKDDLPITISNIQFHLDNLHVDTAASASEQKILFSDNVALQTHDQDILFPDGRHRLSFKHFGINIAKKLVEFDSCTLAATKGDSSKSSFRIFFDKLRLTNIDFDTLYRKAIIKADSVYCFNPQFRLDVELEDKKEDKKEAPRLNELIQQLTGDLNVEFVVVQNASFDINTTKNGKPSSFISSDNNFEMQGLRIRKNSVHPLTVKSLVMAIRNYENFLRDSAYAMQFDSILLINNSINLSNFSVRQMQDQKIINNINIPLFQLRNFSWDDLVFENKLTAGQTSLYRPIINYTFIPAAPSKKSKQTIFQTLAAIGDIIRLNNLDVTDGSLNLNFPDGTQIQLEHTSFSLAGREFAGSNRIGGLQKSITHLYFKKGMFHSGDILVKMEDADIRGKDGRLRAGRMIISDQKENFFVDAKDVSVDDMQFDNSYISTEVNGIQWKEADIRVKNFSSGKGMPAGLLVKNIRGFNTTFLATEGDRRISAFFETLSADEFSQRTGKNIQVSNLITIGKDFLFDLEHSDLHVDRFSLADHRLSSLTNFSLENTSVADSMLIDAPSVHFIPDVNAILRGNIIADEIVLDRPHFRIRQYADPGSPLNEKKLPVMAFGKISILQPDLIFDRPGSNGFTKIEWHSKDEKDNSLELLHFKASEESVSAEHISLALSGFTLEANEKKFNAGNGEIKALLDNFYVKKSDANEWAWQGDIRELQGINFVFDNVIKGRGKLEIHSVNLNNLSVSSATILNPRQLLKNNAYFTMSGFTGRYENEKDHLSWNNAGYNKSTKEFTLHSFEYRPMLSKDKFMSSQRFQTDYVKLGTGKINITSFDLSRYLDDSIVKAATVTINDAVMEDFRDKRLPFQHGITKSMPVDFLEKIPLGLDIDIVHVNNANITYTEVNNKTNEAGTIKANVDIDISSVSNRNRGGNDSVDIYAYGYLMDSFRLKFHFTQSGTDPSRGFLMNTFIGPGNARILNPVLRPLASVRLESGFVDSLLLRASGTDVSAKGSMTLLFHNLKIKLLTNNSPGRKRPTKGLASFLANALAIKNKGKSRPLDVSFIRNRERSFFHYLWKITLNGIARGIGLKNNQRLE